MFNPFRKKYVIPLVAFVSGTVVGATGLNSIIQKQHQRKAAPVESLFDADDMDNDFFATFKRQREEMNSIFRNVMNEFTAAGPGPVSRQIVTSGDMADVDLKDDGSEYVYRIPLNGLTNEKVDVKVDRGMVTVTAESKDSKKLEKGDASETTESMSEFQKTFPLIAGANPAKMDFKVENDSIVIRFPKLKGV